MHIGRHLKYQAGIWQAVFYLGPAFDRYGYLRLHIALLNIHQLPSRGEAISKKAYGGFSISTSFRHPLAKLGDWLYRAAGIRL